MLYTEKQPIRQDLQQETERLSVSLVCGVGSFFFRLTRARHKDIHWARQLSSVVSEFLTLANKFAERNKVTDSVPIEL